MKSVSVFCGSSIGTEQIYQDEAYRLGQSLASQNIKLVYGGAKIGLMGKVADGCLSKQGHVTGVIPGFLKTKEVVHDELSELIEVDTMHERKTIMNDLSEGVIAIPGGFGTMEEFFEILTWGQLGLHKKPMGLLNINGFYDSLISLFNEMVKRDFLKPVNHQMVLTSHSIHNLLEQMKNYDPPEVKQWITPKGT